MSQSVKQILREVRRYSPQEIDEYRNELIIREKLGRHRRFTEAVRQKKAKK
jgi:hypothetical protein